jgi:hypothetical protein
VSTFLVPLPRYSALGGETCSGKTASRIAQRITWHYQANGEANCARRQTENHLPRTRFCNFLHFSAANYKNHPAKCRSVFEDVALIAGSLLA